MASDSSSGFQPGALHISLWTHKTQLRGWKKGTKEQTRTAISSKCKRREFVTLLCSSPCICMLSRACILRETSTKPLWTLTHFSTALLPSSHCLLLRTVSFSGQRSQADCSLLPSFVNSLSVFSGTFLPSSTSGLMGDLTLRPFVWVLHQNGQRDPEWHPHKQKWILTIVSQFV